MRNLLVVFALLASPAAAAQTPEVMNVSVPEAGEENKPTLSALINYQVNGRSGLGKLVPEIFLGFDTNLTGTDDRGFKLRLGPTISSTAVAADSTERLRALATTGNFNFGGLLYHRLTDLSDRVNITAAAGAAIKAVASEIDTISAILQHNVRLGIAGQLADFGFVGVQHTWAWHNLTEESAESFEALYGIEDTHAKYWTVTVSGKVAEGRGQEAHVFATWSKVSDADQFPTHNRRARTLRIGLRADLCMLCSFPAR